MKPGPAKTVPRAAAVDSVPAEGVEADEEEIAAATAVVARVAAVAVGVVEIAAVAAEDGSAIISVR
jgi:hypothetical protein